MITRGIKNRLLFQFWLLFFIAMLIVDVLMVFIFLERTVSQRIDQKMLILKDVCETRAMRGEAKSKASFHSSRLGDLDRNDRFLFISNFGIERQAINDDSDALTRMAYQTLHTGKPLVKKYGLTFGLFFFQYRSAVITYPVKVQGKTIAAGGLALQFDAIHHNFNQIQKIVMVFVMVNSLFLALIGNQQLSRIYYRPLKRLAKRAETFRDEDNLIFSVRKEDNEFSILSSSLNKMLHRIAEDKKVLKETIGSLKEANKELQKAQNDVIRAEKMATVGRLASGIAHEIGNPIGIVLGYLDLLKQTDTAGAEHVDFIDRSEKEIHRVNNIIRQLLDMSRASAGEEKAVGLHQLLEDLVSVFAYQPTANHITIQTNFTATDDRVFADPDQLRQVFLNILLNAVDAVSHQPPDGARISIRTALLEEGTNAAGEAEETSIDITIEDNGPGISPAHLPHVFDPFYTTKEPGKGTGLGLSVSFMIVERLGGHISIHQSGATGAAFQVTLPAFNCGKYMADPE